MADVRVRYVASDEATEVSRNLLNVLRQLQREERTTAQTTSEVARRSREAADGFRRMASGLAGIRATGGLDAIARRVQLLSEGLRIASTRAESLTRLTAIEGQLQRALQRTNLTLADRIRLERQLQATQTALGRGGTAAVAVATGGAVAGVQQLQAGLAALGVAVAATRLVQLTRDAIDAADAMADLSQRTGVAVETLSVMQEAGARAGVSVEGLESAFRFLARSIEDLRRGNQEAVASFAALGLSAADFAGLNLAQSLVRVADAQARFADGSGKVAVAMRLFGRSGEELIPLLNDLADGGFAEAEQRAVALGVVLSTDAAQSAKAFNDAMTDLGSAMQGFKNEIIGLLGPLQSIIEGVTRFVAAIPGPLKSFIAVATVAGGVLLGLAAAAGVLTIAVTALGAAAAPILGVIAVIAGLAGATALTARAVRDLRREAETLAETEPPAATRPDVPTIRDPAQARQLRNAELAGLRDHVRDTLALERAHIQQREAISEAAFARGVTAVTEFYAERVQAVRDGIDAERRALEEERRILRDTPLSENTDVARQQRKNELARLEAQIQRLTVEGQTRVLQLLEQERVARERIAQQGRQFAIELLQAAGDEAGASRLAIEEAANRAAEVLRAAGGFTEDQIQQIRTAFSTLLTDRAAFDRLNVEAQREFAQLARERAAIEERARTGDISAVEAQQEIAAAERARLPALQSLVGLMREFAEEVGDQALLEAVAEMETRFLGMGQVVDDVRRRMENLGTEIREGIQQSISSFLGSAINQARNGLDALRILALGLAQTFQRIFADILAAQIVRRIFGGAELNTAAVALGGSAAALSTSGGVLLTAAGALQAAAAALAAAMTLSSIPRLAAAGFASGGYVRGPGTSTSDSILARLSAGEFVVKAAVVRQPGVRELLTMLNGLRTPRLRSLDRYGVPRYAEGGLVAAGGARAAAPAPISGKLEIELAHSEDTIARFMETPRGTRSMIRVVQKNASVFRSLLG